MGSDVQPKEIIISKEDAVFWMDGKGRWCNQHGPFQHKRIIDYFNAALRKDEQGYYVSQRSEGIREKVYFSYEETALFVVAIRLDDPILLVLNTGKELALRPERLYICNDNLYYRWEDEIAKFNEHALFKISEQISFNGERYALSVGNDQIEIADDSVKQFDPS